MDKIIQTPTDIPIITWLRDPVDRVISNYYYLSKILRKELQEEKKELNILKKMQRSLLEYASAEGSRNRMHKFLGDLNIEDFKFVGLVEQYDEDVKELGHLLGWENAHVVEVNRTGSKNKAFVDQEMRNRIAELNSLDIEIYNQAKIKRERD